MNGVDSSQGRKSMMHTHMYLYNSMHECKNKRHGDAPTHSHMHNIYMWQLRIEKNIIWEVKVEKMVIEVDVRVHDVCWLWWAGISCPSVCVYMLC